MTKIVIIISYSLKFYVCIKKSQDWETKGYGIIGSRVLFSSNYYTKCQDNTHWHSPFKYFVTEIVWPTFLFIISTWSNLISERKILPTWKFSPSFQKYFILFSMIVELRKCFIQIICRHISESCRTITRQQGDHYFLSVSSAEQMNDFAVHLVFFLEWCNSISFVQLQWIQ